MNPWRAQKRAVNSRAGLRHSIKLRPLLQSWRRRNKRLKFDDRHARDTAKGDGRRIGFGPLVTWPGSRHVGRLHLRVGNGLLADRWGCSTSEATIGVIMAAL